MVVIAAVVSAVAAGSDRSSPPNIVLITAVRALCPSRSSQSEVEERHVEAAPEGNVDEVLNRSIEFS